MAVLSHQIKQILLETFIEVLANELNKLKHKNNDKIKYIDKVGNNLQKKERINRRVPNSNNLLSHASTCTMILYN